MRIASATVQRLALRLREPYTIAYDTYDSTVNFLLQLQTDAGVIAMGAAAPAADVTGESEDACEAALSTLASALIGRDATVPARLADLGPDPHGTPAAAAAFDMALWDLRGRLAGLSVSQLLGQVRPRVRTSVTLGIMPADRMLARACEWVRQGFTALKVKGGHDVRQDLANLDTLRRELGPAIELRFDANQGYGVEQAVRLARGTADLDVVVLEQPTAADDPEALAEVTSRLRALRREGIPAPLVMADEAAVTVSQCLDLLERRAADAINLKLMKLGGITAAITVDTAAAQHGVPTMISCMDEVALAIAAGLHLALARPNVRWVDLDGHLDLLDDPTARQVLLEDGELAPSPGPGLGDR